MSHKDARFHLFELTAAFSVLVLSCNKDDNGVGPIPPANGTLTIAFVKADIPPEVALISVRLSKDSAPVIEDSAAVILFGDSVQITKSNLSAGRWAVSVKAKDNSSVLLYSGNDTVTIISGQVSAPTISMRSIIGTWKMSASNPVVKQTAGTPDENQYYIQTPSVVRVNGTYRMWYTAGYSPSVNGIDSGWIAEARSPNGITWAKDGGVTMANGYAIWMNQGAYHPAVLYENGTYKMWFTAGSYQVRYNGIGYATSTDGLNWVVDASRVVSPDSVKSQVIAPGIVKTNGIYYLFYSALTSLSGSSLYELFLSKSSDGISWQDMGRVLNVRPAVSWEQGGVFVPSVIYDENRFKLYYTAGGGGTSVIGYAESQDAINWTRGAQPELQASNASPWIISQIAYPSVMRERWRLSIWFSGISTSANKWQIGFAQK